jgi:hypothetical protein
MNITSQVNRLLDEAELKQLQAMLSKDRKNVITSAMCLLLEDSISELVKPTGPASFDKGSWALERAYRDGGAYHLQQILNIFKEK